MEAYWKKTGKTREPKDKFKLTQAEWNQVGATNFSGLFSADI